MLGFRHDPKTPSGPGGPVPGASTDSSGNPEPAGPNFYLGYGVSQPNWHGQARFNEVTIEREGFKPRIVTRFFPSLSVGASLTYSDVEQPRSWFGHTYGDPDDHVRAEWLFGFVRREWREGSSARPFVDFGTGPMWSNRRIPAATSRINFHTQLGAGATFGNGRYPMILGYRYSHISNGEFVSRNPGWNVHTFIVGTRFTK